MRSNPSVSKEEANPLPGTVIDQINDDLFDGQLINPATPEGFRAYCQLLSTIMPFEAFDSWQRLDQDVYELDRLNPSNSEIVASFTCSEVTGPGQHPEYKILAVLQHSSNGRYDHMRFFAQLDGQAIELTGPSMTSEGPLYYRDFAEYLTSLYTKLLGLALVGMPRRVQVV